MLLWMCVQATVLYAQSDTTKRTLGISATLQGLQYGIVIPIWIGNKVTVGPAFQLLYAETVSTDLAVGLASKVYFKEGTKFSPYAGGKFGFISNIPEETPSPFVPDQPATKDIYGGLSFGGEYFFHRQFSVSVEIQGNVTKSDTESHRFGNPGGIIFNTASMVAANIYFSSRKKHTKNKQQ